MQKQIDTTYFICESLSTTSRAYRHIDSVYNKNKEKYLKLAKKHKYYKLGIDGSIEQEYYFKKVLGIILDDDIDMIAWLLKMTYKKSNQLVKNSTIVNISDIFKKNNMDKFSEDEINGHILAIILLAQFYKKEINTEDDLYQHFIQILAIRSSRLEDRNYPIKYENLEKEEKKELRNIQLKFRNKYPYFSFEGITYAKIDEGKVMLNEMKEEEINTLGFEYIYDLENLNLSSLISNKLFNDKEIQELIACWKITHNNEMNFKNLYEFLAPALQIRYLLRAYKEAKRYCFSNLDEDLKELIEKKENELSKIKEENSKLKEENARLKKELDEKINKLVEENNQLQNKNNNLIKDIENQPDIEEELYQLRNLMFSLSEDVIENKKEEVNINKINSLKAICFGGSNNWINSMKEVLDNWIFIAAGVENFDVNLLNGKDYIFINTKVNSHGMYYKIIENKDKNSKIRYINATNRDRILREIEKEIEQ